MGLSQRNEDGVTILAIEGRLDPEETQQLEKKVLEVVDSDDKRLLFDFSELEYINSSGLRVLVMAYQRMKQHKGHVAICNIRDYILEVFEISGYDKIFSIFMNKEDALQSFVD